MEPKFEILFIKDFQPNLEVFAKIEIFEIFFLFRISSQIWRFSQKLRFSFLKGFQAKKGLVLHVLCPSHPCASLARTVLKPLSFAQAIHALVLHVLSLSLPTLSTSYPAGCEVKSEVKVKTKRFFDFPETYIYYTLCIYLLQKLKKNVQANFVMGLIFRTSWRVAPTKKKFLMGIWIFGILCTNVFELSIDNPCQNFEVFFI